MPTNASIRQQITRQIVEAIEQNKTLPWRRPWTRSPNTGRASNVASRKPYSGINPLLLELHRMEQGFSSRWWGTYRQWEQLGCRVMKRPDHVESGKWGCKIVFYRPIRKSVVDETTGDEKEDRFFVMRRWSVFCADQVEGAEEFQVDNDEPGDFTPPDFVPAEELIEATGADIRFGGDRAFYNRSGDFIQVPPRHRFDPPGTFYETLLHELSHWSESRVGWDHEQHGYAMCELVAEMASSFMAAELGVPQGESLDNHAAYVKSWLKEMKDDAAFIFRASTQAGKVTDYLLSFVQQPAEVVA
jgi:antirestriction protein ArdC